jgi:hypothetical protein
MIRSMPNSLLYWIFVGPVLPLAAVFGLVILICAAVGYVIYRSAVWFIWAWPYVPRLTFCAGAIYIGYSIFKR